MRLFIDSASITDIQSALAHGLVQGVTSNPSLLSKEPPHSHGYIGHLRQITRLIGADTHLSLQPPLSSLESSWKETWGTITGQLQSRSLVCKIPVSAATLPLIRAMSRSVPVNATCVFSAEQAIAAIHAGARYVSFFFCRMRDNEEPVPKYILPKTNNRADDVDYRGGYSNGGAERAILLIRSLIDSMGHQVKAEIICGSIRSPQDALDAFAAGCHIVTAPLSVLLAMANNEQSSVSAEKFALAHDQWTLKCQALAEEESQLMAARPSLTDGGARPPTSV